MRSLKRVLLILILIALALLLMYWPSDDEIEPQPEPIPQVQKLNAPSEIIAPPKTEPQAEVAAPVELTPPKYSKETRDFLELVEHAHSPKDVFEKPGRFVIAHRVDDNWIAQGDILIDPKTLVEGVGNADTRVAQLNTIVLWPENTVPYRIETGLDPIPIVAAIGKMNKETNVRFVETKGETDLVFFRRAQTGPCLSFVGRIGGVQPIWVNPASCDFGGILHEMMHAIGFNHEHSREDRDDYITIHWDQIQPGAEHQFQKLSPDLSFPALGSFDFESVLLYSSEAFGLTGAVTVTKKDGSTYKANRTGLSKGDIAKINALYPKIE